MDMDDIEETEAPQSPEYPSSPSSSISEETAQAPAFKIPSRTISAVEHPFLIKNLDKGIDTFGPNPQWQSVLDPGNPQLSVPLYLHPHDPISRPMMSHYASSHNVLFKITVPKRTGRKRKRGSDEPWQGDVEEPAQDTDSPSATLRSRAKLDEPKILRRKLQDNVGRYEAEAVGVIKHTHRYRGMVDFNYSTKNHGFLNNFTDKVLSGDVSKFRQFSLKSGVDTTPGQEIIPPPLMTQMTVPYYYFYSQNPYVRAVDTGDGEIEMVNTTSRVQSVGFFISANDPIPDAPTGKPQVRDPWFDPVVEAMKHCMEQRPVWTRRSIINAIVDFPYDPKHPDKRLPTNLSSQLLKIAIQYAGYQFKGGPWRDALVKYGYDPRKGPESRIYQCLIFRLRRLQVGQMGEMWQEIRKRDIAGIKGAFDGNRDSHVFDGKTYNEDGKVWQVCDITDPLLAKLLADAPVRPKCDIEGSGWYHRGLWAKARAIMKCKMRAIQFGRELQDSDFDAALKMRDESPDPEATKSIAIPTPDLKLTEEELEMIRGKKYRGVGRRQRKNGRTSYHFPVKRAQKSLRNSAAGEDGPAQSQDGEGGDKEAEEAGEGQPRFEVYPALDHGLPTAYEDGSEYDEDEGDEDEDSEEEEDYGNDDDDDDLDERMRYEEYVYEEDEDAGELES